MPELTFYPDAHPESTSVDGVVGQHYPVGAGNGVTWATIIAAPGSFALYDSFSDYCFSIRSHQDIGKWRQLARAIFLFDTSTLPDGCIITKATFSLYGSAEIGEEKTDELGIAPNVNIYSSAPASNVALVAGDYDSPGSIPFCDTPIAFADWVNGAYNDFELNAAGLAAISKIGITKLAARNANYDVAGVAPAYIAPPNQSYIYCYNADRGDPYKPKLTVTYTILPRVATLPATAISEGAAQANGMVEDDAGSPGDVSFEWDITTDYGQQTPWLSGYSSGDTFWALIYPLAPGTAYHFRARFRNRYGVVYGVDMSFATLAAQGIAVLIDDAALLRFLEVV